MIDIPTPTEASITDQRKQLILNFIHEYRRVKGISPTYQQIAVGIGYAHNAEGTAYTLVNELVQDGWLKRVAPGARSLVPTHSSDAVYASISDPDLKKIVKRQRNLIILRRM